MQPGVLELLTDLRRALDRLGIRWYLFGAQAVIAHGVPRFSDDVDVTIELGDRDTKALLKALKNAGFELLIKADVEAFVRQTRVLPFTHRPSGVDLDLVLAGPGLEEQFLDRAEPIRIGRKKFPVVSLDDLVVLKILAGRGKDLDDVRGLIAVNAEKLDVEAVRRMLREIEMAIDRSDLVSAFDGLIPVRRSRPKGRKR